MNTFGLKFSDHALERIQQRGVLVGDITLLWRFGDPHDEVGGRTRFIANQECLRRSNRRDVLIRTAVIVAADGTIVTVLKNDPKRLLKPRKRYSQYRMVAVGLASGQ